MKGDTPGAIAANRYYDPDLGLPAVKILPGEHYATGEDRVLVSVLGACIGVCLLDPECAVGGMNHFLLPDTGTRVREAHDAAGHGKLAMDQLLDALYKLGARHERLEARVFGAANLPNALLSPDAALRVVEFVHSYLDSEGIPLITEDVLGEYPRKIYFFPASGKVLLKKLKSLHNETLLQRELEYILYLKRAEVLGPYDLFQE
ncbi:chemotaxis protein CheD [Metapseudomonas boanensis]|uniref:Probable chemoreceptor glutamine deamidase CheD n=1 Tax=Metapseudomonas boanensis TaxID=2822138 RepID=A0ABS5XEA9_9GAMM|nr:chemotaxis protein CheD [Pseudomonas boanensis]MBT8765994.1 chemotaxis protein CheD [Pseudomonas boanensis]